MTPTFGRAWSRTLVLGCGALGCTPEAMLRACALESDFNPFARNKSGAFGLFQRMQPYSVTDPLRQLDDAIAFWLPHAPYTVGERLYLANLAPARLLLPDLDIDTVVYSADPADAHLATGGVGYTRSYWPEAYKANAEAFGLNPYDPRGRLLVRHLAHGLDAAVARNRARYDAELTAAYAANLAG